MMWTKIVFVIQTYINLKQIWKYFLLCFDL